MRLVNGLVNGDASRGRRSICDGACVVVVFYLKRSHELRLVYSKPGTPRWMGWEALNVGRGRGRRCIFRVERWDMYMSTTYCAVC